MNQQNTRMDAVSIIANIFFQFVMLVAVVVLNGFVLYAVLKVSVPADNKAAFYTLLGNGLGWFGALMSFGFPNSIGTAKKDDAIVKMATTSTTVTTDPPVTTVKTEPGQ